MNARTASENPTGSIAGAEYVRGMERLVRTVQDLSLARSLPDVQRIVRGAARALTGADGATFVLRDNGQCYYADEDAIAPLWKGSRFPMEFCISGWAMLNRESAVIADIYKDPRIPHAAYRPTFVRSLVMVPIRKLDPIGAIGNYWARERQPTGEEIGLLQALADSTSIAMENVQIYGELEQRVRDRTAELERANAEIRHLSTTDELTGLSNRRGFYQLAAAALRDRQAHGSKALLAFIDVDGLKRVNDTQGHEAGDMLIRDAAQALRGALRESDIVARMGGDEFCVLAFEDGLSPVGMRERLASAFTRFDRPAKRSERLSASIGVVHAVPGAALGALLAQADARMYAEKKSRSGKPAAIA